MKIIFFVLILSVSLAQCQKQDYHCPNENQYIFKNNIFLKIKKKKFSIYESIHKNNEQRFIVINSNSKCEINPNSLLSINDVEGYATNFIRKTKNGFYYSFEYGNRYHYEFDLYFKYVKDEFYLYRVVRKFSDLANPISIKSENFNISNKQFSSFNIHDYLPSSK